MPPEPGERVSTSTTSRGMKISLCGWIQRRKAASSSLNSYTSKNHRYAKGGQRGVNKRLGISLLPKMRGGSMYVSLERVMVERHGS